MTLQATFAATLVDEWVRGGVRAAVVAPGSRSAPLAVALLADRRIECHVRLDERSACYFALGVALSSRRPVVVVTTSGTASAELLPAVLEADLAGVPLICCTADRPPELHHVGAPQTVEQDGLFGRAVRFSCSPGVADEVGRDSWRSLGARLVAEATAGPAGPGPVHCNFAFREPLVTDAGPLPEGRPGGAPWHRAVRAAGAPPEAVAPFTEALAGAERGLILAGAGAAGEGGEGRAAVLGLAASLGWPVLDDTRAWPRQPSDEAVLVAAGDQLLRSPRAREVLAPEVVVRLGAPPASKVLSTFLSALPPSTRQVLVDPFGRWREPERRAGLVIGADPGELCRAARAGAARAGAARVGAARTRGARPAGGYGERWREAELAAQQAIDGELSSDDRLSEPAIARTLYGALRPGAAIFTSSSMPVRDLEWFAAPRPGAPIVLANRGANGIDGIVSSVLGVAAERSGRGETVGLLGDLAFVYDATALVAGAAEQHLDVRLVVVDNAGGGIFSFLPYAASLDPAVFERAFAAPQRIAIDRLAAALGATVVAAERADELATCLGRPPAGVEVVLARTERRANVAAHQAIEKAVVAAVDKVLAAP